MSLLVQISTSLSTWLVLMLLPAAGQSVDVIAFGSCAKEREPQPVWQKIIDQDPDLFLMIGDNHYADFWMKNGKMVMEPVPNVERIKEAYQALDAIDGFQKMKRQCPIMATWDDHDYGANDMGNDYQLRQESQQAFLDFFGFSKDDPARSQEGIYHARTIGDEGHRVQIIMLDTRYHRDPIERAKKRKPGRGPYGPSANPSKTLLGEAQWAWLEKELKKPADIRLIASSIQVVADEHGWETWGNLPHERQRLYRLIAETKANGVFFISGDRHLIEICRDVGRGAPYPIWDFTSSGLNQRSESLREPNSLRVGPAFRETNFGIVRFQWGDNPAETQIHLEGYGGRGQLLTRQTVFLSDLQNKD